MAIGVHNQLAPLKHVSLPLRCSRFGAGLCPAQNRLDPLYQQTLREGLLDVIIGPHFEAEHFVYFFILGSEENDRYL